MINKSSIGLDKYNLSKLKKFIEQLFASRIFRLNIHHLQPFLFTQTGLLSCMNWLEGPYISVSDEVLLSVFHALVVHRNKFLNVVIWISCHLYQLLDVVDDYVHNFITWLADFHFFLTLNVWRVFFAQIWNLMLTWNDISNQVALNINNDLTQPITAHTHIKKFRIPFPSNTQIQTRRP